MEKRQHILLIPALAALTLLSACGFLDEHPRDQVGRETLLTEERLLYLTTLGNLYAQVGSSETGLGLAGTYRGIYDLNTFTTDEAVLPTRSGDWYDGGLWQRLYLHAWEPGEAPLKNAWNYLYRMVVMANQAVEDLETHLEWVAEARAFRAMCYYYLLDLFGSVPLVTSSRTPMSKVAQSVRSEVFSFVFSELCETWQQLPEGRSSAEGPCYGRITQPVALFLLTKLSLNAPVWLDDDWTDGKPAARTLTLEVDGVEKDQWELVAYFGGLIEAFGYGLAEDYAANFAVHNESSVENIFTIPMDKLLYSNQFQYIFRSLHYDHAAAIGCSGENGASATEEVLAANGYGTPAEDPRFRVNYWAGQPVDLSGNPVCLSSGQPLVYVPEAVALDVSGTPDERLAGARMRKYEPDPGWMKDGKLIDNDIVLFRYADVLLMRAEALLRAGKEEPALPLVNLVRARAGATPLETLTLEALLAERMREFAWEGWRRQDLIRFGQYTRSWSSRPALPGEEGGYTTVFPIPADALALNPLLRQHKGY